VSIELYAPYLDWIDSQSQHMVHLTEQWSRINSGSYNLAGLAQMLKVLEDNFLWLNASMERVTLPPLEAVDSKGNVITIPVGQALRIRQRPDAPIQIFLGGHMDTVFGADHPFQEPRYLNEHTLNGPGVADLKGGLVVMLKALEAFERSPWAAQLGYEIVINPDEEIGSQSSDFLFKEAAARNQLGLIYEPALRDGTLAGARKGTGNFTFVVRGRAAHAGREFELGRNAIVRAADVVQALNALNGVREGVTVNVGKIEGGGALNVVPDLALVRFNVRVPHLEDQAWIQAECAKIQRAFGEEPDYQVALHGCFTRAPKPMSAANESIFNLVKAAGELLGQPIQWKATGGCCDGNNLWSYGLPNVDTLGVRGGDIHSDREFVLLESLAERSRLSALILMRLAAGDETVPSKK